MDKPDATAANARSAFEARRAPIIANLQTKRRPIRLTTIFFVFIVCLALGAMHVMGLWNARLVQLSKAEVETRNMAWVLAGQAENTIKLVDTVLVGMVEHMETIELRATSTARLQALMRLHVTELSLLQGLFIYDETGRWIVNTSNMPSDGRSNADREYFKYHRANTDRGPHIGRPIIGRTSNAWVIPISRRLEHADGSFAGVALATVKIDFFRRFYKSLDVGRAGSVFLALGDGTLLLRTPFDSPNIGTNISQGPLFGLLKSKGPVGSAVLVARVDGVERIYSYRHLPTYPLFVAVGRSKQEVLTDWRATTTFLSVALALLIALLLTLGVRVVRQIGYRDRLERELGEAKAALESSNAALTSLAFNDGLTGLANRRHFEKALNHEWRTARRSGASLALVMLDADHFKQYNDLYGHPAGDQCLRSISRAIKSGLRRPGDMAARYGGEEFAVLLPATGLAGARAVAEPIRAAVQDAKLEHRGNPAGMVTISAGVCALVPTAAGNNPLALVREADRALYAAKAEGRNRVAGG